METVLVDERLRGFLGSDEHCALFGGSSLCFCPGDNLDLYFPLTGQLLGLGVQRGMLNVGRRYNILED